ncbi:MAG: hypothetical protein LBR11_09155 [Deltaproteobacteria bacterium]|jgi:hypothetical protein|nr:hypothetical protein [Deltaproteobacteria bacterium]
MVDEKKPRRSSFQLENLDSNSIQIPVGYGIAVALGAEGNLGPLPGAKRVVIYQVGPEGSFQETRFLELAHFELDLIPADLNIAPGSSLAARIRLMVNQLAGVSCLLASHFYGPKELYLSVGGDLALATTEEDFNPLILECVAYSRLSLRSYEAKATAREAGRRERYLVDLTDFPPNDDHNRNMLEFMMTVLKSDPLGELVVKSPEMPSWLPRLADDLAMIWEVDQYSEEEVFITLRNLSPDRLN